MGILLAKAGVVGAACVGCIITYQCVSVRDSGMPRYHSLNLEESATDGKYLKDIYQYFVDVDAKNSEQWWKGSFNYRGFVDRAKKVDIGPTFSAVTGLDEFKKACKGAYSKRDVDLPERDRISLGRYCSPLGEIPKSVDQSQHLLEHEYGRNQNSPDTSTPGGRYRAADLISTYDEGNNLFGDIKETLFFGTLGKYDTGTKNSDGKKTVFDRLYDSKGTGQSRGALKNACREAYKKSSEETGDGRVTADELLRYCGYKNTYAARQTPSG